MRLHRVKLGQTPECPVGFRVVKGIFTSKFLLCRSFFLFRSDRSIFGHFSLSFDYHIRSLHTHLQICKERKFY